MKTYTVTLIPDPENPEELILPLPEEMLAEAGWKTGDTIRWIDNQDGTWSMVKQDVDTDIK